MKTRHTTILRLGLGIVLGAAGCTTPRLAQQKRVVYGERNEHELAYEFLQPRKTNGLGVVVMVSGSWRSNPDDFKPMMGKAFLRRGYSMFAVSHLSQPKATIPEIYDDVTRAVRHIREHADEYGVDPGQARRHRGQRRWSLEPDDRHPGQGNHRQAGRTRSGSGDFFPGHRRDQLGQALQK